MNETARCSHSLAQSVLPCLIPTSTSKAQRPWDTPEKNEVSFANGPRRRRRRGEKRNSFFSHASPDTVKTFSDLLPVESAREELHDWWICQCFWMFLRLRLRFQGSPRVRSQLFHAPSSKEEFRLSAIYHHRYSVFALRSLHLGPMRWSNGISLDCSHSTSHCSSFADLPAWCFDWASHSFLV